ncbi:O-antigen ligase family protein [Maribacter aurantiacus]|uniref:O-antigen ligase family protein n=1 Tax=Maribacter aurantiacus TaxID=1882343 RepID=UPI0013761772|nr:O-antigen ligase family protein [Maribacter aurantiacus]
MRRNLVFNSWLLILGIFYFGIGSLVNQTFITESTLTYLILIVKYFITIIGGYQVLRDTSKSELLLILIIGCLTVFLQIFIFYNPLTDGSRYSGFYLNPNSLGFICIMGYGLTFSMDKNWKLIGQIIFTIVGFLTFSRTFIIVWLLINVLAIRLSIKNIRTLLVGGVLLIGLITYNSFLPNSNARLDAMTKIFEGKSKNTSKLEEGGRTETWANFYPFIYSQPIFGNGYGAFSGNGVGGAAGVHNAYLKVIGEAGIFAFLIFILIFIMLIKNSYDIFLNQPHLFLMSTGLSLFLLTNHNYFDSGYVLFFTMWLQFQTKEQIDK